MQTQRTTMATRFQFLLSALAFLPLSCSLIVSGNRIVKGAGQLRYFYDSEQQNPFENVVLMGVGTGMQTSDYDSVSMEMAQDSPVTVVVMDHNPGCFVKTCEKRFANMANSVVGKLDDIIPTCTVTPDKVILGGHSAGGQAAWNSRPRLAFTPAGFLGLDPFRINQSASDGSDIPTLNFGFTKTTCSVATRQAAKAGYEASNDENRVFYQIDNSLCASLGHCSFTDRGFMGVLWCPTCQGSTNVRRSVGRGVGTFLASLQSGNYDRQQYTQKDSKLHMSLFINDDEVPEPRDAPAEVARRIGSLLVRNIFGRARTRCADPDLSCVVV